MGVGAGRVLDGGVGAKTVYEGVQQDLISLTRVAFDELHQPKVRPGNIHWPFII